MHKANGPAILDGPKVSVTEARRFNKAVTVRDQAAFLVELNELVREKVASANQSAAIALSVTDSLRRKANALKANTSWVASVSDVQQGRNAMLREFSQERNLPLTEFARLAHKSRQQVYKDIAARRLLALNVGKRGQRLPDWQLDPTCLELTRFVLAKTADVDEWTVYHALSEPLDRLDGHSPVAVVRRGNVAEVLKFVLGELGIHGRGPVFGDA